MWTIRKHGRRCCSVDSVLDDTIIVEYQEDDKPEDIELKQFPVSRVENQVENDPVNSSILDRSDWTDDDISKDNSFSWMEKGSTVEYLYMHD